MYTVEHLLLIAIEAAATLCSHVLAKTARRAPVSYGECFEGLLSYARHNLGDFDAYLNAISDIIGQPI